MNKPVSNIDSQVGKYIDINGDGIPEGVIFADLAVGAQIKYKKYRKITVPTINNLKEYVVIGTYDHPFNGKQDLIMPAFDEKNTMSNKKERFYVLALEDLLPNVFWYAASYRKMKDFKTATKMDFGAGRKNTLTMIDKWHNAEHGKQNVGVAKNNHNYKYANNPDIWGEIQNEVNKGWFVPSAEEWIVFLNSFSWINQNDYNDFEYEKHLFDTRYWSSSQATTCTVYECWIGFTKNVERGYAGGGANPIRLAITA